VAVNSCRARVSPFTAREWAMYVNHTEHDDSDLLYNNKHDCQTVMTSIMRVSVNAITTSGPIPRSMELLQSLEVLNLSQNDLEDVLQHSTIMSLKNLVHLNLSDNMFKGSTNGHGHIHVHVTVN